MATSVLGPDERVKFESLVTNCSEDGENLHVSGTLLLTEDGRILFVTEKGVFNKKYDIMHDYTASDIESVRLEKRLIGKALTVDVHLTGESYTFRYEGVERPESWVAEIYMFRSRIGVRDEVIRILNSRERTKLTEVQATFQAKASQAFSVEEVVGMIQKWISNSNVKGFIDEKKQEFVHLEAYRTKTERVNYNIATSFNLSSSGTLEIKCPYCGGSQELAQKQKTVTCKFCGKNYLIPEKIHSLL